MGPMYGIITTNNAKINPLVQPPKNPNFLNISLHVLVTEIILKTGFHKAESDVKFEFNSLFRIYGYQYMYICIYFSILFQFMYRYTDRLST